MSLLRPSVLAAATMALGGIASANPAALDVTTVAMSTVTVYLPSNSSTAVFTNPSATTNPTVVPVVEAPSSSSSSFAKLNNHTITVGSSVPVVTPVVTASLITIDGYTYTEGDISTFSNTSLPTTYMTIGSLGGGNRSAPTANGTYTLTIPAPTASTAGGNGPNGKGDNTNQGTSSNNAGAVETGAPVQRQAAGLAVAFLLPMLAF